MRRIRERSTAESSHAFRAKTTILDPRGPIPGQIICATMRSLCTVSRYGRNRAHGPVAAVTSYANTAVLAFWSGLCRSVLPSNLARTWKSHIQGLSRPVCFSTSVVHLELATDYSAQGFIAAYKRFTSRCGLCSSLISDYGTNFVGADAELRRMFNAASQELIDIANDLASSGTEWRFNPPAAPHFGGKWEAAKSVKFHLKRLIGNSLFVYEEFTTLLIQIEAILNSHPLCPLSDDPNDLKALTPAHFLIGGSFSMIPKPSLTETKSSRLSRWQILQQITQQFWHRWSREYLQRFQDVSKWKHPIQQINIGLLVLLIDERLPPAKWLLGRVTETHAGQDSLIRVVTVRTATSTVKRPIVKLCPLPIST